MDEDDLSFIGGTGTLHELNGDDGPPPRLWGLKSVSRAAAVALDRRAQPERRPIGFHLPRAR